MARKLAVIGGSGLFSMGALQTVDEHALSTPYGELAAPIQEGKVDGTAILFLPRHGVDKHLPPHAINYRANIWALRELGASHIVTINIVGGIGAAMAPGTWVIPDQIIDYTWGREHSYSDGSTAFTEHVDFTEPYDSGLCEQLRDAAACQNIAAVWGGTYGCTQGPRLETAAEVRKLQRDGCDIVGMTAMPEAALARELNVPYAGLCLVVNWGAGLAQEAITVADMEAVVSHNMPAAVRLIAGLG